MIEIDGSKGGGQMLRSSLSLSAITGREFRIENIRGSRREPGLKRQHLEAVKTAKRISRAEVNGLELGSEKLVFRPHKLNSDPFTANIGTAGSVTLLFDTVLPISTQFNSRFRLTGKGGTDVKWSPTFSYFREVKLPLLKRFGLEASARLEKTGYYPSGGGEATLETSVSSMNPIRLEDRGRLERFEIYSKASKELESQNVAERQASEAERKIKNSHMSKEVEKEVRYDDTDSTGSSLLIKAVYENSTAGFDALGEQGKRSEKIAEDAVKQFKKFHSSSASIDPYMSDQIIIFLALVGGKVSIPEVTDHVQTSLEVAKKFGREIELEKGERTFLSY